MVPTQAAALHFPAGLKSFLRLRGSSQYHVGNTLHPLSSASHHMQGDVFLRPEAIEEAQAAPPRDLALPSRGAPASLHEAWPFLVLGVPSICLFL